MRRQSIVWFSTFLIAAGCHPEKIDGRPGDSLAIVFDHATGTSSGDTLVIGDYAKFSLMGPDSTLPTDPVEWTVSDTTVMGIESQNAWEIWLGARRSGRATLTVTYQGQSGTHDLVARALRASDTAVAVVAPVYAEFAEVLGDTVMVAFSVSDARGGLVFGCPCAFSLSDSTILQLSSTYDEHVAIYRSVKAGTTLVTLTCESIPGSATVVVQ